jgi:exonuclease SbcC
MIIPLTLYLKDFLSFKEETIVFKQNETTCVMGRNLTEDSQESNGSGKSVFQSGIELVYTGSISRKINKVKMIRRGCTEAKVVHEAWNSIKNEFIRIERTIPLRGSETIAIHLFTDREAFEKDRDKYKVAISSTLDSNKWIEKYIGIDKSDISNYFIPNELTYTSFFNLSDTKTKELISRFSNADIVDTVFVAVKVKSDAKGVEIVTKEKEQLKFEGIKERLQDDLVKEQKKDFEKEKSDSIAKKNESIAECNTKIAENTVKLDAVVHSLSHFNSNIIEGRRASLNAFKQHLQMYRDSSKNFEEEYGKINADVKKIQDSIDKSDKLKRDFKTDISSVESDINDMKLVLRGKISCPKCNHEFNPSSTVTVEEATKKLKTFEEELKECLNDLEQVEALQKKYEESKATAKSKTKDVDVEQRAFDAKDRKIGRVIGLLSMSIDRMLSKIESYNSQITKIDNDNQFHKGMIKTYKDQIKILNDSEKDDKREKELKADIHKITDDIVEIETAIKTLIEEQEVINKWNINFKLFKSFLANKKLKIIQDMINKCLQDMKCDYRLKLEGFKTLANGETREKITPYIFKDGEICDYGEFSKGERARIDFATLITLQSLVNDSCETGGLQILFMDEIGEGIDSQGLKSILDSFKNTKKTILITTHVTNESIHDNVMMIEKVNGISRVVK